MLVAAPTTLITHTFALSQIHHSYVVRQKLFVVEAHLVICGRNNDKDRKH